MEEPQVWTFFYGSYINFDVLKEVNIIPEQYEIAKLNGFDIQIQPLANLIRSEQHCVYGIVAKLTHKALKQLYAHAQDVLGGVYFPEPVLVETLDGKYQPALCYIAHTLKPKTADPNYIQRIIKPAKKYGFPAWYIARLESLQSGL